MRLLTLISSALCCLALLGCPTDTGTPDGGSGQFTWGFVLDFLSTSPVDGANVCIKDTDNCSTSDGEGAFQLNNLGENEDILVSFDDNRYFPAVGHYNTARSAEFDWRYRLPTEDAVSLQVSLAGQELERGVGQVFFAAAEETGHDKPRVPGLVLTPSEGSEDLGPPVYGNDVNVPDPDLTETSSQGIAVFSNIPPGVYSFEVSGDDDCFPYFSLDSPDGGRTYVVHVFENTLSAVTIVCPQ